MKLLEYEAKALLKKANIAVPTSQVVGEQTRAVPLPVVLKSQVPTGGRGKAGGIRIVEQSQDLVGAIHDLLALPIKGHTPRVLLAEEKLDIDAEYYVSLLVDRSTASVQLVANRAGGIDVEANDSDSFLRLSVDPASLESCAEALANYLTLDDTPSLRMLVEQLYSALITNDAVLIEINPLVLTTHGTIVAGDAKIELDDAAIFRHPEWQFEHMPISSNFVVLDQKGTVATIANGAGLAMATVDAVADQGMKPANFLDIGGGATSESVFRAFQQIMKFAHIQAIIINIFAGITRCDEVANAIVTARSQLANLPPLFIRLSGTNVVEAKQILAAANIDLLPTLEACVQAAKHEVDHE